jgi:hypothetical protein
VETWVKENGWAGASWLELFPANKCGALPKNKTAGILLILNF